jgi:adenylate cyclase
MAIEIEKKFLVKSDDWKKSAGKGVHFSQGYLTEKGPGSVRVRIEGDSANLNIKSATLDMQRLEYEYAIPLHEAEELLDRLCLKPLIEKTRYKIQYENHVWEVDVFEGDNAGLVVAEIELQDKDELFSLPGWVGEEVTEDKRYYNVCLVKHPFKDW